MRTAELTPISPTNVRVVYRSNGKFVYQKIYQRESAAIKSIERWVKDADN